MDDIKPNQSLDGMSGGRPAQPTATPQNAGPGSTSSNSGGLNQFNDADYAPDSSHAQDYQNYDDQQHGASHQSGGSSGKGLKIALTLFVILFIAATAAAVYFYMESSKETPTVTTVDVSKVEQENASLTYDNKTLTTQNTLYKAQIKSLNTTAEQLKTKCGTSCKAIVIPQ